MSDLISVERKVDKRKEYLKVLNYKLSLRHHHPFGVFVHYGFGTHQESIDNAFRKEDHGLIPDKEWEIVVKNMKGMHS